MSQRHVFQMAFKLELGVRGHQGGQAALKPLFFVSPQKVAGGLIDKTQFFLTIKAQNGVGQLTQQQPKILGIMVHQGLQDPDVIGRNPIGKVVVIAALGQQTFQIHADQLGLGPSQEFLGFRVGVQDMARPIQLNHTVLHDLHGHLQQAVLVVDVAALVQP